MDTQRQNASAIISQQISCIKMPIFSSSCNADIKDASDNREHINNIYITSIVDRRTQVRPESRAGLMSSSEISKSEEVLGLAKRGRPDS